MSDTNVLKINRWVNILFPKADWDDKNTNGRIDKNELRPASYLKPLEKEKAIGDIRNIYIPLIEKIDGSSHDGVSYDEIKTFITPTKAINYDFDLDKVIQGLKSNGRYKVPNQPILFVNEDNIPEEIREEVLKYRPLGNHAAEMINIDYVDGKYKRPSHEGKTKSVIILVSNKWLGEMSDIHIKWGLKHELIHARQWFNGQMDEWQSVMQAIIKSEKFNNEIDLQKKFGDIGFPNALFEINAYKLQLMGESNPIDLKDYDYIKNICLEINFNYLIINRVLGACKSNFANKVFDQIITMGEEAFSTKDVNELNKKLAILTKDNMEMSKKCRIYRDITVEEHKAIYNPTK